MAWSPPDNHVWTTGEVVTATNMNTYIRLNLDQLPRSVQAFYGNGAAVTAGVFPGLQVVTGSVTAAGAGTAITWPVAYSTWAMALGGPASTANPNITVELHSPTATGATVFLYVGASQITSGTVSFFYWVLGV